MNIFYKIYKIIFSFFIFLSCKQKPINDFDDNINDEEKYLFGIKMDR
jgi:hypothetical protein